MIKIYLKRLVIPSIIPTTLLMLRSPLIQRRLLEVVNGNAISASTTYNVICEDCTTFSLRHLLLVYFSSSQKPKCIACFRLTNWSFLAPYLM